MKSKKRRSKPKPQSECPPKKKLRSQLPRRRRARISPVFCLPESDSAAPCTSVDLVSSSVAAAESSCGSFQGGGGGEVSSQLNAVFELECGAVNARTNLRKTRFGSSAEFIDVNLDSASNGVTRACFNDECEVKKGRNEANVEVSESSCVESNSGVDFVVLGRSSSKLKIRSGFRRTVEENEDQAGQAENGALKFELTDADVSSKLCGKGTVPLTPCVESWAESIFESVCSFEEKGLEVEENRVWEFQVPEIPRNEVNETFTISKSDSTIEQWPNSLKFESDLACTEQLSYEDVSEYSCQDLRELQSTILMGISDTDCSDYTPSNFLESGSEFSEKSNEDAAPSSAFSMLLQFRSDFLRSCASQDIRTSSSIEEENADQSLFLRLEGLDDEETYRIFRNRERRQLIIRDYVDEYRSTTDYGDLILQQRSNMVQWIVERSRDTKLHQETTFLGVTLLDQILRKGFFKAGRHLQILGVACLTLATRIEENQSYSWMQQRSIRVGDNTYRRSEVVGMEWLVQEVLKFQCFLPTVYNFLGFYLKAAGADSDLENRAKNFAVLVLSDQVQFCYFPSTIAAAVVLLASFGETQYLPNQRVIETHVRTESDDLPECIESLEWLLKFV
ncbi:cyclin-SDS-like [Cucurbita maxima]|uniref:B-like cyclin n=1 Tax=Cucurbita maxima TaxID=3661 RepID=A0A6J1K7F9_CUCMA|nr:cyclin-SDS-like [Cucurbita maxima]